MQLDQKVRVVVVAALGSGGDEMRRGGAIGTRVDAGGSRCSLFAQVIGVEMVVCGREYPPALLVSRGRVDAMPCHAMSCHRLVEASGWCSIFGGYKQRKSCETF